MNYTTLQILAVVAEVLIPIVGIALYSTLKLKKTKLVLVALPILLTAVFSLIIYSTVTLSSSIFTPILLVHLPLILVVTYAVSRISYERNVKSKQVEMKFNMIETFSYITTAILAFNVYTYITNSNLLQINVFSLLITLTPILLFNIIDKYFISK